MANDTHKDGRSTLLRMLKFGVSLIVTAAASTIVSVVIGALHPLLGWGAGLMVFWLMMFWLEGGDHDHT